MKTKLCYDCKRKLPISLFRTNKEKKDGLQGSCIECRKEYNREHYLKNKKIYKENARKRRIFLKEKYEEYKKILKCSKCQDDRWYVLEFHHKEEKKKENNVSEMVRDGYSFKNILKEIEKCDVLCANCHKELHYCKRVSSDNG